MHPQERKNVKAYTLSPRRRLCPRLRPLTGTCWLGVDCDEPAAACLASLVACIGVPAHYTVAQGTDAGHGHGICLKTFTMHGSAENRERPSSCRRVLGRRLRTTLPRNLGSSKSTPTIKCFVNGTGGTGNSESMPLAATTVPEWCLRVGEPPLPSPWNGRWSLRKMATDCWMQPKFQPLATYCCTDVTLAVRFYMWRGSVG